MVMKHVRPAIALVAVLLVASGCAYVRPPAPPVVLPPGSGGPTAAWGRTLARVVDDEGRIDFRAVAADLDAFVGWVATVSPARDPELFPTRAERLAYYLNAYNALAMYNVLHSGRLPRDKVRFFLLTRLDVGGEPISLYALENHVIRPLGEPRIHFALNCMVRGCPRLPRQPFEPARLDAQLDREARRFLNEERNVRVDAAARTVHLSSILNWYESDFLAAQPTLIDYVNQYRDAPIPADYDVEFLPYDWTLNQQ
jgi:Protein of unknown function, DUF547